MITKANPGLEQRLAEAALSVLGAQVGETALACLAKCGGGRHATTEHR